MKKIFILSLLSMMLSFFLLTIGNNSTFAETEIKKWTVEETIKKVREGYCRAVVRDYITLFRETRLNPDARSEMYRILNDKNEAKVWANAVTFFAIVGQEEDVPKLVNLIEKRKGTAIDSNTDDMFTYIIITMSVLELRGIKGAGNMMDKMITPEYWQNLNMKRSNLPNIRLISEDYAPSAVFEKLYTGDPKAKEKVQSVCNKIPPSQLKEDYVYRVESGLIEYDDFMEAKKSGDWKTFYEKRKKRDEEMVAADIAAHPTPKPTPTPKVVVRRDDATYTKLWESTRLLPNSECWETPPALLPPALDAKLAQEALEAFDLAIKAYLKHDLVYWQTHHAPDGRPRLLPEEQTPDKIEESVRAAENFGFLWTAQQACQEFVDKNPKPAQHSIFLLGFPEAESKGTSRTLPAEALTDPKKYADVIVIRFRYDGMQDFQQKYRKFFLAPREYATAYSTPHFTFWTTPNCDPVVTMVWEAGQWYWVSLPEEIDPKKVGNLISISPSSAPLSANSLGMRKMVGQPRPGGKQ
jgi:hypothetical protein